jgi:hypothetical protein
MSKADMQRRHFELTVGAIRLLRSPPMHARSLPASDRSPPKVIYNNIARGAA